MSIIRPIYDPNRGPMKIVGLISGSGTRLVDLLEHQERLNAKGSSPYKVVGVFSENPKSKAKEIGERFNLPTIIRDLRTYCRQRGKKITDIKTREEFDQETVLSLPNLEQM